MSSTLMWRSVCAPNGQLPYELKKTLSRKLWNTDGSIGGDPAIVGAELVPYLEGLRDVGVKGASELIELIKTHGRVELWHEH